MQEQELVCEICGKTSRKLGRHIRVFHNISSEEYYLKYILNSVTPPICDLDGCNNYGRWSGELNRGYFSGCCAEHSKSIKMQNCIKTLKSEGRYISHQTEASNNFWKSLSLEEKSKLIQSNLNKMMLRYSLTIDNITFTNLQGYEGQAIRYLISNGYKASDIISKPFSLSRPDNKLYLPDLQIYNTIIEVKSEFTINNYETEYSLEMKSQAVIRSGLNFTIFIMDGSGNRLFLDKYKRFYANII